MTVWPRGGCSRALTEIVLVTCEHGGNGVPPAFRRLFKKNPAVLDTHRGWDKGALILARELSSTLGPLFFSETTRLLVDLNRSLHHRKLFSEFTADCDKDTRRRILEEFYYPYRRNLETAIARAVTGNGRVIHLSIHSFAPELDGITRNADIGLLYDPARHAEFEFCATLQAGLQRATGLKVRRNYPYLGTADGLTTHLRRRYRENNYLGIEIEINQRHVRPKSADWAAFRKPVIAAVAAVAKRNLPSIGCTRHGF